MVEKSGQTNGQMETAFALWTGKGKVAFSGFVKEQITIPAGAKVLAFQNGTATPENKQPNLRLVYVVEN